MKHGTLQDLWDMARDLSARSWNKPLGEYASSGLRKGRDVLCQEWAAAGVSFSEAVAEVNGLLQQARQTHAAA